MTELPVEEMEILFSNLLNNEAQPTRDLDSWIDMNIAK
jgi:hypothetical protein